MHATNDYMYPQFISQVAKVAQYIIPDEKERINVS